MVEKAQPGTISSVILSIVVVGLLLMPFYMANQRDKVRTGEGEFEFKEVMFFDINEKSDFQGDDFSYLTLPFPSSEPDTGTGASYLNYLSGSTQCHVQQPVSISNTEIDGVVDGYGVVQMKYITSYTPTPNTRFYMYFFTTLTKADILERETTYLDIFLDIPSIDCDKTYSSFMSFGAFGTYYREDTTIKSTSNFEIGKVYKMDLAVDDLLAINNLDEDAILSFGFSFAGGKCTPSPPINGVDIVFDMQVYNIEEVKITTIDYMGIAMLGGGIFMTFCSILMLPHVTFRSIIGGTAGKNVG